MSESSHAITLPEVVVTLRPDGIIDYNYTTEGTVDLDVAQRALAAAAELISEPAPSLVRINRLREVTREARICFAQNDKDQRVSSKIALITDSPLARIIGNFFMGLNSNAMPIALFSDAEPAVDWLLAE